MTTLRWTLGIGLIWLGVALAWPGQTLQAFGDRVSGWQEAS